MAKKSKRNFYHSTKSTEQLQREDYRRSLPLREANSTVENKEQVFTGSTNYKAHFKEYPTPKEPLEEKKKEFKISKIHIYIVTAIAIVVFIGGLVREFTTLTKDVESLKQDFSKVEADFKNQIQHINDRIDRYIDNRKKR